MSAPQQIKFHGQLYTLVTAAHKKCPKGQHWNYEKNLCMPLPKRLQRHTERAWKASAKADAASLAAKGSKRAGPHLLAAKSQDKASVLHYKADRAASQYGFDDLSHKHNRQFGLHSSRAVNHEHIAEDKPL